MACSDGGPAMHDAILSLQGVSKGFGGLKVINGVSFTVRRGSRTALIGPNGAGKTTIFNLVSGVYPVDEGSIHLDGKNLTALPARVRIAHGVARSFQNVRLMPHLSTVENVMLGELRRMTSAVGKIKITSADETSAVGTLSGGAGQVGDCVGSCPVRP